MNRALLAASLALVGGGAWLYLRQARASPGQPASPDASGESWLDSAGAAVSDVVERIGSAAETSFEQIVQAINPGSREEVLAALAYPNVQAFLSAIRAAEGTAGENGYRTLFGGRLFDSFTDHPRVRQPFRNTRGETQYTTAAGAYQFLSRTWDKQAARLGLADFSPGNQDAAAAGEIRDAGALQLVLAGAFDDAVARVAPIWASLPGGPYPQPSRSVQFIRSAYEGAGGTYA